MSIIGAKRIYLSYKTLRNCILSIVVKNPPIPRKVESILFVCLGNICRSSFAEYYAKNVIKHLNIKKPPEVFSAGISVSDNHCAPMPQNAVVAAKAFCVDMEDHCNRKINKEMLESYDMIFAMEINHFWYLRRTYPELTDRFFLITLLDNNLKFIKKGIRADIVDPFGRPLVFFYDCFERIEGYVDYIVKRIICNECI